MADVEADAAPLCAGARVRYRGSDGEQLCSVLKVHHDDIEPYYTLRLPDGRERATTRERLEAVQNEVAGDPSASPSASPSAGQSAEPRRAEPIDLLDGLEDDDSDEPEGGGEVEASRKGGGKDGDGGGEADGGRVDALDVGESVVGDAGAGDEDDDDGMAAAWGLMDRWAA